MNQPGRLTKNICTPAFCTSHQQIARVTNHVKPAAQLKLLLLNSAKLLFIPSFLISQKSTNITAPIGISSIPYNATNPSSFIAIAGNIPAAVATPPANKVTAKRDFFGMIAWKARPDR